MTCVSPGLRLRTAPGPWSASVPPAQAAGGLWSLGMLPHDAGAPASRVPERPEGRRPSYPSPVDGDCRCDAMSLKFGLVYDRGVTVPSPTRRITRWLCIGPTPGPTEEATASFAEHRQEQEKTGA